jgi:dTDP-4-amino-4,6-dideoxygalactose transaminase
MILMNNFNAEPKNHREDILLAVQRVLESGSYVLGQEIKHFEKKWANICNVNYAVAVGNGMDAIEIALRALKIKRGDEVITTAMTAFATVLAIYRAGAIPVLADIEADTGLLCMKSVERCITKKTKAIILVHLYGHLRNIYKWDDFCKTRGIFLVEDCAQAHLAKSNGRFAGSFGIAAAFSFYPTKNLGAVGDAGALITNSKTIAENASCLRNYGQSVRYHHSELGMNSRMDEIQAAILSERLRWLGEHTQRRKKIAQAFYLGINNQCLSLLTTPNSDDEHVYHLFVITCMQREHLQQHLAKKGVQTLIHYPLPIHHQKPCISILRDPIGLTTSENHASTCLSLPCHPQMSNADVDTIIDAINSFKLQ